MDTPQRLSWTTSPLYRELSAAFPEFRTRQQNVLDVERIAAGIGMTEEGVYKWLRQGRILSPKGVQRLVELANQPENLAALERRGRAAPTKDDLAKFMLA
jgi:hypothetical protein